MAPSWNAPVLTAPSPKKATATRPSTRSAAAVAAPTAIGTPAPTMPFAPKIPSDGSAMCIEPPRPRQLPPSRPNSSANAPRMSSPFASTCPCPRWVEVMTSSGPSAKQVPTGTASCPTDRCRNPGMLPCWYKTAARSSKSLIRSMLRYSARRLSVPSVARCSGGA